MSEKKRGERRKRTAAEKLRIVLAGLQADTKVSELCRREGITATQFYQWKDRLLGSAVKVFETKGQSPSADQERVESGAASAEGRDRGDHGREPGA